MADKILFIRKFPEKLMQQAKGEAALSGMTLTAWIIMAVKKALGVKA